MSVIYVLAVNLTAYLLFAADKRAAQAGARRVRESNLLLISALGGSPGALVAQALLRHKTRKQPFRTRFFLIMLAQAVVLAVVVWLLVRAG